MWLKEMESGKYFNENYIAHSIIDNDETIAILTYTRILIVRSDSLKLSYDILLNDVHSVESGANGVHLRLDETSSRVLSLEEQTSRDWFAKIINQTLTLRNEERERQ
jgi:vacuolar protein sorting-associated protein 13A/C